MRGPQRNHTELGPVFGTKCIQGRVCVDALQCLLWTMIPCAQPGSLQVVTTKSGLRSVKLDRTKHELLRTEVNMLQLE